MNIIKFNPLLFGFWRKTLETVGWPLLGVILLMLGSKSFEARDSATVMSGAVGGAGVMRGLALFLAGLVLFFNIKKIELKANGGTIALLIYVVVVVSSVLWSSVPIATIGKASEICVGFLLVAIISAKGNSIKHINATVDLVMGFIVLQLLIVLLGFLLDIDGFSEFSIGGFSELIGRRAIAPFISGNSVGYFSVILITYLIGKKIDSNSAFKLEHSLFICLAFVTLILSSSRTSLGILLLIVFVYLLRKNKILSIIFFILTALLIVGLSSYLLNFIQGGAADSNLMSLSGRTILWEGAYEYFKESPVFGYGFGVGSRDFFYNWGLDGFDDAISSVHNGILEILLGVGVIGFLPWLAAIVFSISIWRREFFSSNSNVAVVSVLPVLLICSVMSVGVGGAQGEMFTLFALICAIGKSKRCPSPLTSETR